MALNQNLSTAVQDLINRTAGHVGVIKLPSDNATEVELDALEERMLGNFHAPLFLELSDDILTFTEQLELKWQGEELVGATARCISHTILVKRTRVLDVNNVEVPLNLELTSPAIVMGSNIECSFKNVWFTVRE